MDVNAEVPAYRAKRRIHLVAVVWGNTHIWKFLQYTLPSLIPGLDGSGLCRNHACTFFLHTREQETETISNSAVLDDLRKIVPVEVCPVSVVPGQKYWSVSAAHIAASNRAYEDDAYVVFLVPDAVYSIELFASISKAVNNSRTGLFVLGLRSDYESIAPVLDEILADRGGTLVIPSRDAVRMALDHVHPEERWLFWNSGESASWLPHVYFGASEHVLYAACWHLHPMLIRPSGTVWRVQTIDGGAYLDRVIKDVDEMEVITDSDRGFFVELSPRNETRRPAKPRPMTIRACVAWALRNTRLVHRILFAQIIRVHANDIEPELADPRLQFASEIVSEILYEYDWKKSHRLVWFKRWKVRDFVESVLASVRAAYRAFGRLTYRASRRLVRPVVPRLMRSPALRQFAKTFIGRLAVTQRVFVLFLEFSAWNAGRAGSTPEEDTVVGRFTFERGLKLLDRGKLDAALTLVRTSNLLSPHPERQFYVELIGTLVELKKDAEDRAEDILRHGGRRAGEPVVFAVVVWGKDYVDAFLDFTVRTLLAPSNLPALTGRTLLFSIVTDDKSKHLFEQHATFQALKKYAQVEFFVFPSALTKIGHYASPNSNFYRLYGALDHTSIHFARALKGHIFFVVADGLFARGTVPSILRYLAHGYEVCVNASLVAKKEEILPALEDAIGPEGYIDMSSWDLANLCFRYRHDYISQRIITKSNINFDKYPRELYFPDREGLVVHALYQHPWAISASAICRNIELDYHIVDFRLVSRIFSGAALFEKLKVIEDSAEVFIANFAPEARRFDTTGAPFSVQNFIAANLHSQPIHWYIWTHRQLIRCDTTLPPEKNSELVATKILNALRQAAQG